MDAVLLFIMVPHEILGVELLGLSYVGAAIANLITYVVVFGLSIYYASRQIPVKLDHRPLKYLAAIAAAAMAAYGLSLLVPVERWYDLVLVSIVSYCVFALVLLLLKELQKRDLDYFLDVVNVGEMMTYIRSELKGK